MEVFQHRCWLGHGSYGDVQLCEVSSQTAAMLLGTNPQEAELMPRPILIALKTWKQAHTEDKVMRIALREVQLLKAVNHPNIIKLQCAFRTPSGRVCMAFEYGGKSTHQLLETRFPHGIPQQLLQRLAFQLVQALRYLHSQRIVHRDVKPANVLVDSSGVLRLCDFGFARCLPAAAAAEDHNHSIGGGCGDGGDDEQLTPYVITRWYRSPEVLLGMKYGAPTDVWSLGCTLAELATGEPMVPGTSSLDQIGRITGFLGPMPIHMAARVAHALKHGGAAAAPSSATAVLDPTAGAAVGNDTPLRRRLGSRLIPELVDLVAACLRVDPRDRPTAEQLLNMPYFAGVAQLFEGTSLELSYCCDGLEDRGAPPSKSPPSLPPAQLPGQQKPGVKDAQPGEVPSTLPLPPLQQQQQQQPAAILQAPSRRPRCHPHPHNVQQHTLYHQHVYQPRHVCGDKHNQHRYHHQHQQQRELRTQVIFRSGGRLPVGSSIGSSADGNSTVTCASATAVVSASASACCSTASTSGGALTTATRSISSMSSNSVFSTVALGSSSYCCCCSGGGGGAAAATAGGSGDMAFHCPMEAAELISETDRKSSLIDKAPPTTPRAEEQLRFRVIGRDGGDGGDGAGDNAGNAATAGVTLERPAALSGDAPATATLSDGCSGGGGGGLGGCACASGDTAAFWHGTATATAFKSSAIRTGPLEVVAALPPPPPRRASSAKAVVGGGAAVATIASTVIPGGSWPTPVHQSGFSREAAIRAMNAAAAFGVAGDTATVAATAAPATAASAAAPVPFSTRMVRRPQMPGAVGAILPFAAPSKIAEPVASLPLLCSGMSAAIHGILPPQLRVAASAATAVPLWGFGTAQQLEPRVLYNALDLNDDSSISSTSSTSSNSSCNSTSCRGDIFDGEEGKIGKDEGGSAAAAVGNGGIPATAAHWLDAYYHEYSPLASPPARGATARAVAASAAAVGGASTNTTMSFNWHSAESPLRSGGVGHEADLLHPTAMPGNDGWPVLRPSRTSLKQQQHKAPAAESPPLLRQPHQPLQPRLSQLRRQRQHLYGNVAAAGGGAVGGGVSTGQAVVAEAGATAAAPPWAPPPQQPPPSQQHEQDFNPAEAEAQLISSGLLSPAANALAVSTARSQEGSRHRRYRHHRVAHVVQSTATDGEGGADIKYDSSGSSYFGFEGCRPCDLAWTHSVMRTGYASSAGCGGAAAGATRSSNHTDGASAWPLAPSAASMATAARTMLSRQSQQGEMPSYDSVAPSGAVLLSHGSVGNYVDAVSGAAFRRGDGEEYDARPAARHGIPVTAPPQLPPGPARAAPAVVATAVVTAMKTRSVVAERRSSLESLSCARSCRTSIEERGWSSAAAAESGDAAAAAVTAAVVAWNDAAGRGSSGDGGGGSRRVKGWFRKGRVWLRNILEGGSSSAQQRPPRQVP